MRHAAGLLAALACTLAAATAVRADRRIVSAQFAAPTTRYDHGVLGDAVEWGALRLTVDSCPAACTGPRISTITIPLPADHVFEDLAPRLADLDDDGAPEVLVVETDLARGAALAVYGAGGKIAETPHIGRRYRWLAPVGAADLDRDGRVEIAYVDRPHLARILRIWRFENGALTHVADAPGLTNHRIGQDEISGGIRDCGAGAEIVTANADWSRLVASTLDQGRIASRDIGTFSADGLRRALACR